MQEEPATCRSGAPTQVGSRSSDMRKNTSSMPRVRHSMFMVVKMKKQEKSLSTTDTTELTRNGQSSISTRLRMVQRRA